MQCEWQEHFLKVRKHAPYSAVSFKSSEVVRSKYFSYVELWQKSPALLSMCCRGRTAFRIQVSYVLKMKPSPQCQPWQNRRSFKEKCRRVSGRVDALQKHQPLGIVCPLCLLHEMSSSFRGNLGVFSLVSGCPDDQWLLEYMEPGHCPLLKNHLLMKTCWWKKLCCLSANTVQLGTLKVRSHLGCQLWLLLLTDRWDSVWKAAVYNTLALSMWSRIAGKQLD